MLQRIARLSADIPASCRQCFRSEPVDRIFGKTAAAIMMKPIMASLHASVTIIASASARRRDGKDQKPVRHL